MKKFILFFIFIIGLSCQTEKKDNLTVREDFTKNEQEIIAASRTIVKDCYYGTLITVDKKGQPRARVMEPFTPDKEFTIWMATNPKSRKVTQIENNSQATMHFFDKAKMGYVSLMGNAYIVNDDTIKSQKWKDGWEQFYGNKKEAYLLIKFIPETLELISSQSGHTGDKETWQPHKVLLRK